MNVNHIGIRIREARKNKGWKQIDLVKKIELLGVHYDNAIISRIERGMRNVSAVELCYFAKVLEVSPFWLTGVEESCNEK